MSPSTRERLRQIIFDLCVVGVRETEYIEGAPQVINFSEPSAVCPFCGANELTRLPDDPIFTGP